MGGRAFEFARNHSARGVALVHVGAAHLFRLGNPYEELLGEAERGDDAVADIGAVILPGDRLDQHRGGPMRGAGVVLHARAGGPFDREIADQPAQQGVIGPRGRRNHGGGKSGLVRQQLMHGDVALAVLLEAGDMIGDAVAVTK